MDEFFVYGNSYHQALKNLEKVLIRFHGTNLALSDIKFQMMQVIGIIIRHYIFDVGIQFDFYKD